MLSTSYDEDQEVITVPYGPLFDEIRRNSGFVDVRGRPDLAAQTPEGAGSPNLKKLLIALSNTTSPLFTLGCDLGTHEEREHSRIRYGAGGYIQVMKTTFAEAAPDEYLDLARAVSAEVDKSSADHDWELQH
jgi:hypothetical protein